MIHIPIWKQNAKENNTVFVSFRDNGTDHCPKCDEIDESEFEAVLDEQQPEKGIVFNSCDDVEYDNLEYTEENPF